MTEPDAAQNTSGPSDHDQFLSSPAVNTIAQETPMDVSYDHALGSSKFSYILDHYCYLA